MKKYWHYLESLSQNNITFREKQKASRRNVGTPRIGNPIRVARANPVEKLHFLFHNHTRLRKLISCTVIIEKMLTSCTGQTASSRFAELLLAIYSFTAPAESPERSPPFQEDFFIHFLSKFPILSLLLIFLPFVRG